MGVNISRLDLELLPWCDVCRKTVDRMDCYDEFDSMSVTYIAHCHGEREKTRIDASDFLNMKSMRRGVAFSLRPHLAHTKLLA